MNGRLGIISGAAFAGVVAAAVLIGGVPGFAAGDDDEGREGNRSNTGVLVPIADPASANQAVSANDTGAASNLANSAFLVESGSAYYGDDEDDDEHDDDEHEHEEHERDEHEHDEDDD